MTARATMNPVTNVAKRPGIQSSSRIDQLGATQMLAYGATVMGVFVPYLQSVARIIFGFLLLRHGMEQVLGYPEVSHAPRVSFEGAVELIAFPAGLFVILGLYTRPVSLVLAVLYFILFFLGPLQVGPYTHRNGGDPILLNAFFLLYLSAAGAGAWSVDRL